MKSSAGKVLPLNADVFSAVACFPRKITLDKPSRQSETARLAMFKTAFCTIAHPTMYNSLFCLNSSTGTRSLRVTLQNHETRLSGIIGSKLHISGWFSKICYVFITGLPYYSVGSAI